MKTAKIFTTVNFVFSGILWLLGILTLLFNDLGLWNPWNYCGFAFLVFIPFTTLSQSGSFIVSCVAKERKYIIVNGIMFVVSLAFTLFTVFVSATWFW